MRRKGTAHDWEAWTYLYLFFWWEVFVNVWVMGVLSTTQTAHHAEENVTENGVKCPPLASEGRLAQTLGKWRERLTLYPHVDFSDADDTEPLVRLAPPRLPRLLPRLDMTEVSWGGGSRACVCTYHEHSSHLCIYMYVEHSINTHT